MWDVVVVGAGPAGATAALAARRERPDARVLLLDRADFPRDKACGDGVAAHVLDVLGGLGVSGLLEDRVPVRTLELAQGPWRARRQMRRPAWVVPRRVLDARLVEAAVGAGVELARHRVREVEVRRDGVVLDRRIRTGVVVAADGAYSTLRRLAGLPAPARRALALRGYAPTPPQRRGSQVIGFGRDRQPSYAWAFDRGDGWSNVGYGELLRPGRAAPTRRLMLQRLEELLPGSTQAAGEWLGHHLPLSSARLRQPDGRVLLAGDAAGLINPVTGEGLYYAVASGASAGRAAVAGGDAGTRHRRSMRRVLSAHLATTAAMSRLTTAPGVLPAALRAAAADQGVFDDLVEVGLGRGLLTPRVAGGLARHLLP